MRSGDALSDEVWAAIRREVEELGGGQLRLEPYEDDAGPRGVDLGADQDQPQLVEALCEVTFALARAHQLEVFDPQLGRLVSRGDADEIRRQALLGSAFSSAVPLAVDPVAAGSSASLRLWLIIGAACLAALVLARALSCAL